MLMRTKSTSIATVFANQALVQWRHVPQAKCMSDMRYPISRMLLSTNSSRIMDISHDTEMKRGLTTSGEKQGKYVSDKPIDEEIKESAGKAMDTAADNIKRMANNVDEKAARATKKVQKMADDQTLTDSFKEMGDQSKAQDLTGWQKDLDRSDASKSGVKKAMREVGNVNRVLGDGSKQKKQNAGGKSEPSTGAREEMDLGAKQSYDVAARVKEEAMPMKDLEDRNPESIKPGTRILRGTEDNFNNDPGMSIGDAQDKVRETKDKITGGADHMMDSLRKSMMNTGNEIKETLKGVSDATKETVETTATKTKEFLTGEREREKPDETKSEVRKAGKNMPSHGVSQPGSSEETTKWQ